MDPGRTSSSPTAQGPTGRAGAAHSAPNPSSVWYGAAALLGGLP